MRKRKVLLVSITLALLLVGIGAGGGEGESPPPVLVPVVLDGVRYKPEEFNRIHQELYSKGVYLIFTVDPQNGDFLAFSAEEGYNEWLTKHGLPPWPPTDGRPVGRVVKGDNGVLYVFPSDDSDTHLQLKKVQPLQCPPPDPYWSRNWEHIHCCGGALWVPPDTYISDLRDVQGVNWNDRISSVQAATSIWGETLWEHINRGGESLSVLAGWTYPDLRDQGWNDRASSLQTW